jgi:hypothetical protein
MSFIGEISRQKFKWRGAQDQKIRQPNPMSNTKDENELTDAKGVPLSHLP